MTHEELTVLLDYHYWARDRLLDAVERLGPDEFRRDLGNSFGSVRDTLVHIVSAEWVWCSRWEGQGPSGHLAAEDFATVEDVRARWSEEEGRVRGFVAGLGPDPRDPFGVPLEAELLQVRARRQDPSGEEEDGGEDREPRGRFGVGEVRHRPQAHGVEVGIPAEAAPDELESHPLREENVGIEVDAFEDEVVASRTR